MKGFRSNQMKNAKLGSFPLPLILVAYKLARFDFVMQKLGKNALSTANDFICGTGYEIN